MAKYSEDKETIYKPKFIYFAIKDDSIIAQLGAILNWSEFLFPFRGNRRPSNPGTENKTLPSMSYD